MQNARLSESQAGIKIARRNINSFRYTEDTTPMVKSKQELKILLKSVKGESEKAGLKLYIKKLRSWLPVHHFVANRWGKSGSSEKFYFLGFQNHCGW